MSWGETLHHDDLRNSIDPAAPSGSMGILATTDRGFPSGFSFSFIIYFYMRHRHLLFTLPFIYSFIYLPICI